MMRLFRRKDDIVQPPHELMSAARSNERADYHVALDLVGEARGRFAGFFGTDVRSSAIAEALADAEEGLALAALERYAEAEPLLSAATEELAERPGGIAQPRLVIFFLGLAQTRIRLHRPQESLAATECASKLLESADLSDPQLRYARASCLILRAEIERMSERLEAALAYLDAAVAIAEPDAITLAICHSDRAGILYRLGLAPEMEANARQAVDLLGDVRESSLVVLKAYLNAQRLYCLALHAQQRHAETLEIWEQLLPVAKQTSEYLGRPHDLAEAYTDYANALDECDVRLDEAAALLDQADAILPPEDESRAAHYLRLNLLGVRAENLQKRGRPAEALVAAERSLASHRRYYEVTSPEEQARGMAEITRLRDRLAEQAGTSQSLAE
ncbi:tetratricopeptide (TPR) repeat protein [Hamadaea flava]|uniref:Tetratricopeptide repeat protein n=1 Tax=Hamadaea flava TaxID=1742688 RepID=A0ABV8LK68_9ACTN|nr:hypothetical protein [Hamadaea flava]MCP2323835.1 tetratricopeptide (TPR) repeat protein [Hamadaea flava]